MTSAKQHPSSTSEKLLGILILIALCGIAYWVYLRQFTYNAAITEIQKAYPGEEEPKSPPAANQPHVPDLAPEGFRPLSEPEVFYADTLSDKINGKAELYLNAGFVSLRTRRFALKDAPMQWMELFIYRMGKPREAFAVYSVQRRSDAIPIDLTDFAYTTENALFMVHGDTYVEIVASDINRTLQEGLETMARNFVRSSPADVVDVPEIALLPGEGLRTESIVFYPTDGFGFHRFNDLVAAQYVWGDIELTAFVTIRDGTAEAVDLASAYCEFLVDNGGTYEASASDVPEAAVYNLFGTYEIVFSYGPVVAGIHQAEDLVAAEKLAARLFRTIREESP